MRERGERGRAGDERQGPFQRRKEPTPSEPRDTRTAEGKLEWKPKSDAPRPSGSRRREPGARRDRTWRPGGEHRDPRQKYKDAKKAKWTRFKQTIRTRWEKKRGGKKTDK